MPAVKSVRIEGTYSAQSDHLMVIMEFNRGMMDIVINDSSVMYHQWSTCPTYHCCMLVTKVVHAKSC